MVTLTNCTLISRAAHYHGIWIHNLLYSAFGSWQRIWRVCRWSLSPIHGNVQEDQATGGTYCDEWQGWGWHGRLAWRRQGSFKNQKDKPDSSSWFMIWVSTGLNTPLPGFWTTFKGANFLLALFACFSACGWCQAMAACACGDLVWIKVWIAWMRRENKQQLFAHGWLINERMNERMNKWMDEWCKSWRVGFSKAVWSWLYMLMLMFSHGMF